MPWGPMALFCVILMGGFVLVKEQHPPLDVRCTAASCNTCFEPRPSLQDRSYVLACAAVITCPPKHPCCSEL